MLRLYLHPERQRSGGYLNISGELVSYFGRTTVINTSRATRSFGSFASNGCRFDGPKLRLCTDGYLDNVSG